MRDGTDAADLVDNRVPCDETIRLCKVGCAIFGISVDFDAIDNAAGTVGDFVVVLDASDCRNCTAISASLCGNGVVRWDGLLESEGLHFREDDAGRRVTRTLERSFCDPKPPKRRVSRTDVLGCGSKRIG